ncbi:MAG: hypothetical protein ABIH23_36330 [bacterium]
MKYKAEIVRAFYMQEGLPKPTFEHRFCDRRWRLDVAWPEYRIAIECQGGLFLPGGGRHNRGAAMLKEYEKLNTLAQMGWSVIFVIPQDLCLVSTVEMVKRCMSESEDV